MRSLLAVLLMAPGIAMAGSAGYIDGYYIPSAKFDVKVPGFGSADDDGDGFGARLLGHVTDSVMLTAEYQSTSYDDSDIDYDQLRFGAGLGAGNGGVFVEYVDADLDDAPADGFGLHLRLGGNASDTVGLHGQIGYLMLEDEDGEDIKGLEFSVGISVALGPQWSAIADYRKTSLEDDNNTEFEFGDFRAGLRLNF